jgi:hypothetical protein
MEFTHSTSNAKSLAHAHEDATEKDSKPLFPWSLHFWGRRVEVLGRDIQAAGVREEESSIL